MRRAFTLIELLVVIAIIAILAAILFPVFAQAKQAAKKTQCLSNEKQVGTAVYLYLNDADDTLPMANLPAPAAYPAVPSTKFAFHGGEGVGEQSWADLIQPYAKSLAIFTCPSDSSGVPSGTPTTGAWKGQPLSLALNYYFYKLPGGVSRFALSGGTLSELANTSNKIFIAESSSKVVTSAAPNGTNQEIVRPDRFTGFERHGGGSTYVMADTHAKYHAMPQWWKTVPSATWGNPENASLQPCPQWFPWVDDSTEKW